MDEWIMLQMHKKFEQGILPCDFKKCEMSDLMFIYEMDKVKAEKKERLAHEIKVKEAMEKMRGARW